MRLKKMLAARMIAAMPMRLPTLRAGLGAGASGGFGASTSEASGTFFWFIRRSGSKFIFSTRMICILQTDRRMVLCYGWAVTVTRRKRTMNLIINGETKSFQAGQLTIREMLGHLDITLQKGVAVALNNAVIPQSQWEKSPLSDGDHIEVIRATQGG